MYISYIIFFFYIRESYCLNRSGGQNRIAKGWVFEGKRIYDCACFVKLADGVDGVRCYMVEC